MSDASDVIERLGILSWNSSVPPEQQQQATQALEQGKLLLLPQLAFELSEAERRFLSPSFVDAKTKNISFNASNGQLKGAIGAPSELAAIQDLLVRFATQAKMLVDTVLPHYQGSLDQARTSLRPVQVSNRKQSYRKDDRRLHVDAFQATPNQGRRILRVFTNINPHGEDRVWHVGEAFETVAQRFLPAIPKPWPGSSWALERLKLTKSRRTEYDHIMLQLHDRMKKNMEYQRQAQQVELRLPAGSSWIVQTDQVSHAALSGQHMLEQTFYLPVEAMLDPEQSPLKILERLVGRRLV